MQIQPIPEEDDIDLEFTDGEPESVYSETDSDREFIAPDDDFPILDDPTYQPSDVDETASTTSGEDDIPNFKSIGQGGSITVLDERDIIMVDGRKETELLIRFWAKDSVVGDIFKIINSSGRAA